MKGKRWLKRLAAVSLLLVIALVALALTYAYWLPWAARPIAQRFGVSFGKYERLKDGRFVISDVVSTNRLFDLRISRVEGFLPHVWRTKLGEANVTEAFLEVNGWRAVVHDRPKSKRDGRSTTKERSIYAEWERVERYITKARQMVPKATFLNGALEHQRKEYTFSVVTWDHGVLDGSGVWPETAVPFEIKGKLTGEPPYQLYYAMTPIDLRARLRVVETNGLLNTQLAAWYKETRADVAASFGRDGVLPRTATLKAPDFKVSADTLKLERYSFITGDLSAEWRTNQYTIDLKAHAEPLVTAENAPPADIEVAATGGTNSVRVDQAVSTLPGLELSVTEPLEVSYKGRMLSERSLVRVNADLEKVPWLKMNGRVQGTILLERERGDFPKATFRADGTNISALRFETEGVSVEGTLNWPRVENFNAEARFGSDSFLRIKGGGDLEKRVLGDTLVGAQGAFLTNFLPRRINCTGMRLEAKVSGALTNLEHSGELELRNFDAPQLQPFTVEAAWKARQITFDELAVRARAGPATVFVSGSGYAGGGRTNFVVRDMSFLKGDETYLSLAEPARVTVTTNLAVQVEPLVLIGTNEAHRQLLVSLGWRHTDMASVEVQATNVNPSLFQSFFTRSLSGLDLEELKVTAGWSNGPVTGSIAGRFSVQEDQFERLTAAVDLRADTKGLAVRRLSVMNPEAEIATVSGFVPLTIHPGELETLHFDRNAEIDFEAATEPNVTFWETISRLSRLELSNAAVRLTVRGTLKEPTGELQVNAAGVEYMRANGTNRPFPSIDSLAGRITLNEQVLRIPEMSFSVKQQRVAVSGNLELGENFWTQRREEILQYALDRGELRIVAPEVELAAFTEYLPKDLRPQGKLFVDVSMQEGTDFRGEVRLRDVETRPLPKIGVIQEIEADLALRGKEVRFENVSATLGGERLTLRGRVDLSAESVARGYPDLDLAIAGENVPLARNPDVILRSDLNLRITNSVNRIPVVSGTARLQDSFLLRDISTLVPGRVARPERRPPYFSITQDPLDEWLLDVRVRGENFMRVRSPFFQGEASANFHVVGTLAEPMALGEAAVSSGSVIFPFATLAVRQALVSLTSENPYLPHIFVVASGRAFGFDLRMEAEGPADQPVIEFSSVPALTSEQIVLMLTTGQIPRDDFGFSAEDRAGRLALFLGKSLWTKLNPGKPAEERLTIRSGEDVTEQGKQTYEVEYKLNDRWSLVGEYDRFGELNANVKWRVFSK